jgi:hypothetical protein
MINTINTSRYSALIKQQAILVIKKISVIIILNLSH